MDMREFKMVLSNAICEELANNSGIKNPEKYVSFVEQGDNFEISVSPAIYNNKQFRDRSIVDADKNIDECLERASRSIGVKFGLSSEVTEDEH